MVQRFHRTSSLVHILQWAFLAEVLLQVFLPPLMRMAYDLWPVVMHDFLSETVNSNIIMLNHAGAILAGLVTAFAEDPRAKANSWDDSDSEIELSGACSDDDDQQEALIPAKGNLGKPRKGKLGVTLAQECADAFTRGFVAVLTSYLAVVEHLGELLIEAEYAGAAYVFVGSFIGGPVFFIGAVFSGRQISRWVSSRYDAGAPRSAAEANQRLLGLQLLLSVVIIAVSTLGMMLEASGSLNFIGDDPVGISIRQTRSRALSMEAPEGLPAGLPSGLPSRLLWWQLPCGLFSVGVALVISDKVAALAAMHTKALQGYLPSVDLAAAIANASTLVFGHAMVLVESSAFTPDSVARLMKVHSTLGGTLSAYSGFTEAVAKPALLGEWRRALINWILHSLLAVMGAYFVIIAY